LAERFSGVPLKASNLLPKFWIVIDAEKKIQTWVKAVRMVALFPVSTADVERVVSVFTDVIGDDQFSSMEETIEARVLVRFNNRTPKKRVQKRFYDDGALPSDDEEA
jgi:hypothetical protein